jgi:hypothetical protein
VGKRKNPMIPSMNHILPVMVWPDEMMDAIGDSVITAEENATFASKLWDRLKNWFA